MTTFDTLEQIYNHLDEKAAEYQYESQIADLFQRFRDKAYKENLQDQVQLAQWEIEFWQFVLTQGELEPHFTGTDDKGEPFQFPDLKKFDDAAYDYLLKRLDTSKHPFVRARYANILWHGPRKHTKFANAAVDANFEVIDILEALDKGAPQDHRGLDVIHRMINLFYISRQSNYRTEDVKGLLKKLVHNFNLQSSSSFPLRFQLINLMLKEKLPKEDFLDIPELCWNLHNSLVCSGNLHGGINMLQLGDKVESRIGSITHEWKKEIGLLYEKLMNEAEKNENPAAVTFAQWALENFKMAKDASKVTEFETKVTQLKGSVKMTEFSTEIDLTEHIQMCKSIAEKIVAHPPEEIVKMLMHDKDFLPRYDDVEKAAAEIAKQTVAQHLFPAEISDENGNVAQHFTDEEEKNYFEILQEYNMELQYSKLHLIHEVFLAAIRAKQLTTRIFLSYLQTNSWFGKTIQKQVTKDKIISYSWLNLLAPSIHDFFLQFNYMMANFNNKPNFVLCIDSLTLKLEGLFRDLCKFSGVTTWYPTKDDKGRTVYREKDINRLLHEDKIKDLFDKDDLLFLRFLLVEKAGFNLRHRVAHSLMTFEEYGVHQMCLLLLALLKLGRYDFIK